MEKKVGIISLNVWDKKKVPFVLTLNIFHTRYYLISM